MIKNTGTIGTSALSGLKMIPFAIACDCGQCAGTCLGHVGCGVGTAGLVTVAIALPSLLGPAIYVRYRMNPLGSPAFSGIMNKEIGGKLRANVVASVKGRMAKT